MRGVSLWPPPGKDLKVIEVLVVDLTQPRGEAGA